MQVSVQAQQEICRHWCKENGWNKEGEKQEVNKTKDNIALVNNCCTTVKLMKWVDQILDWHWEILKKDFLSFNGGLQDAHVHSRSMWTQLKEGTTGGK